MSSDWQLLEREVAYDGFFRLARYRLRHRRFDGSWSPLLTREIFERGHAAAVLPYDAERDRVALVEQFRPAAIEADGGPWLLECVAGIIEADESAEDVVRREAIEEAGCNLGRLERICKYLASPGGTTETTTLFCGAAELIEGGTIHGVADENEDIRVHVVTADDAIAMADDGRVANAMSQIALHWLARNRERLRAEDKR
jgi:ADP-ribose pyrophosphatase